MANFTVMPNVSSKLQSWIEKCQAFKPLCFEVRWNGTMFRPISERKQKSNEADA